MQIVCKNYFTCPVSSKICNAEFVNDFCVLITVYIVQLSDNERMEVPEKKAWSALHGAWGKRPVKQAQYNGGTYNNIVE